MAAVFALVFLPVLASVGLVLAMLSGDVTFRTGLASMVFILLASGVFGGLFKLARGWEAEAKH